MPLLLRKARAARWIWAEALPWLEQRDVPADPIGDLSTTDNRLSVWEIEADRSNIPRVLAALAVGGYKLTATGYLLFESDLLARLGLPEPTPSRGGTKDIVANDKWHRDVVDLTGKKLLDLTRLMLEEGSAKTLLKKELIEQVRIEIERKELPEECREILERS